MAAGPPEFESPGAVERMPVVETVYALLTWISGCSLS
jgi:hypothetical protein